MQGTAVMRKPRHLTVEKPDAPASLAERGRILYAEDIQELYGRQPRGPRAGKWRRSLQWIWANFAPQYRHKDGKTPFWFERDALQWLDEQRERGND